MGKQTEILEKSVAAAQTSADAANANIELVVNKERGRIFVEVDDLDFAETRLLTHQVTYRVVFHSPTVSFIENTAANVDVTDSAEPDEIRFFPLSITIRKVIPPAFPTQDCRALFFRMLDQFEIDQVNHQKSFVHFRGFIKYRDFMG